MSRWLILAMGIALVALYLALAYLRPGPPPTQTAPPSTSQQSPTPTPQHTQTQQLTQTAPLPTPTQTPTSTTPPQTTPRETQTQARRGPAIKASINAPALINTTKLPINITYTVVLTNGGDEEGIALINGEHVVLKPGETKVLNRTLMARSAGNYTLKVETINATYATYVVIRYYAPKFQAKPVTIAATRLPAASNITITVTNIGNGTGWIDGVEVPPGASVNLTKTLSIAAAGRYVVKLGDTEVPVEVIYLAAVCTAEVESPREVEVVPGEAVNYAVRVRNTGNASAVCVVNGTALRLAPGEEKFVTSNFTADKAGRYVVAVDINGTAYRAETQVKVVSVFVWFKLKSPYETPYRLLPHVETFNSDTPTAQIEYVWRIFTNATTRTVTLVIDGAEYKAEPHKPIEIPGRATINKKGKLSVRINGTEHQVEIVIKPNEPTITQRFTEMQFTSTIRREVRTTVIGVTLTFTIAKTQGVVTYGAKTTVSAEAELLYVASVIKIRISAEVADETGEGEGEVTYSEVPLVRPGTTFRFKFRHSGGKIAEITEAYINKTKVPEEYIPAIRPFIDALPAVLKPPPTGVKAADFARALVAMFTEVSYVGEYTWDGYVEVGTPAGAVKVFINPPKAEGPLAIILK